MGKQNAYTDRSKETDATFGVMIHEKCDDST
jgi:hypothetical protein